MQGIQRLELIQRNHTSGYEDLEDQNLYPTDFHFIISIFMLEKGEGRCASQWKVQPIKIKHLGHTIFQNCFFKRLTPQLRTKPNTCICNKYI